MDKGLLKDAMKKNNLTAEELCKKIDMSRSAFYRKCNGMSEFTVAEIKKIVAVLHLESPMAIFFADKVS